MENIRGGSAAGGVDWRQYRSSGRDVRFSSQDAAQKVYRRRAAHSDRADYIDFVSAAAVIVLKNNMRQEGSNQCFGNIYDVGVETI